VRQRKRRKLERFHGSVPQPGIRRMAIPVCAETRSRQTIRGRANRRHPTIGRLPRPINPHHSCLGLFGFWLLEKGKPKDKQH
jgi:hypothetical protein